MMIFNYCFMQGWLKNFQHLLRNRYLLCSQVLGAHESLVILSGIAHMGKICTVYKSLVGAILILSLLGQHIR